MRCCIAAGNERATTSKDGSELTILLVVAGPARTVGVGARLISLINTMQHVAVMVTIKPRLYNHTYTSRTKQTI